MNAGRSEITDAKIPIADLRAVRATARVDQ
jgi:hypothetical protein